LDESMRLDTYNKVFKQWFLVTNIRISSYEFKTRSPKSNACKNYKTKKELVKFVI